MPTLTFEGAAYSVEEGQSILDSLIRGGANVPFSCRKGSCHTCMLQCESGDLARDPKRDVDASLAAHGMFLPCTTRPADDVTVRRPDLSVLSVPLMLSQKRWLSPTICELSFEPERATHWRPGQFMNLRRSDGVVRSYSIASIGEEDYFLSVHVKRIPGGVMSNWLLDTLEVGDMIDGQGPVGTCTYDPDLADRDLLLLATGSGLSPILGVCRDAIRQGHRGRIVLYHGSRDADGLYLRDTLAGLASAHARFEHHVCLTGTGGDATTRSGRIVPLAFDEHPELDHWVVYLCGVPDMVHEGRVRAVRAGVRRSDIHADAFEFAHGYRPKDRELFAALGPSPALWEALRRGEGLREILTTFYTRVYADPRLAPFFHRVTIDRAIGQQYAFLADAMTGRRDYFGLDPYNAHHWMVISDELFDYREAILEGLMRDYGLSEALVRQWSAIHETFRAAIVKSSARGLIVDGVERPVEPPEELTVEFATICDGCQGAIDVGERARYHPRSGQLYCASCAARPAPP
ncbi:MAG: 2Fe-2S iron-sulfur cluster binding domain-containing protein [Myxococcales bacterium]|nr:2Fe-2S iron-sulfur cluster binding domain-containing protein [Myxococcales bacterium]